jgi:hypothetical protein
MPACENMTDALSRLVDGECARPEAERVRAHAAGCAGCREALDDLEVADRALRAALGRHPFDAALAARIAAAARRQDTGAPRVLRFPRRAVPFAAAAAALVAVTLAVRFGADRPAAPKPAPAVVASITADKDAGVLVMRGSNQGYVPSGARYALRAGDRLRAERRMAAISFADGSEVLVRPDTTVEVQRLEVAVVDGPGEVFASAAPAAARGGARVRVGAPGDVSVVVLGTRFSVRFDGEEVLTTVAEDEVGVLPAPGTQLERVPAGVAFSVSLAPTRAPERRTASRKVDVARELAWALRVRPLPAKAQTSPTTAATPTAPLVPPAPVDAPTGASSGDLPIGDPKGERDR